ncbi:hypothetical protein E3N88_34878 [Mikania micrantha]|uniref:Uncharacterized protein n=1 Tax=Mikania micrantha TaxID=192012 RepID=A0A5N6LZI8_9ASTR|nr:hypothetical protein E3N88_34878 [Mikania micrantha]
MCNVNNLITSDYHSRYRAPGTFRPSGKLDPTPPARGVDVIEVSKNHKADEAQAQTMALSETLGELCPGSVGFLRFSWKLEASRSAASRTGSIKCLTGPISDLLLAVCSLPSFWQWWTISIKILVDRGPSSSRLKKIIEIEISFHYSIGFAVNSKAKQAYDPLIDDYDLDNEEDEECVVTKVKRSTDQISVQLDSYQQAVGLFGNPMAIRQRKTRSPANAPQKSKGKGASSSSTPKVPPPKKTESKRLHQLIDEDDEDDEEMEEEFGVSEDDEEEVELGIDVDDDEEDSE